MSCEGVGLFSPTKHEHDSNGNNDDGVEIGEGENNTWSTDADEFS